MITKKEEPKFEPDDEDGYSCPCPMEHSCFEDCLNSEDNCFCDLIEGGEKCVYDEDGIPETTKDEEAPPRT